MACQGKDLRTWAHHPVCSPSLSRFRVSKEPWASGRGKTLFAGSGNESICGKVWQLPCGGRGRRLTVPSGSRSFGPNTRARLTFPDSRISVRSPNETV